MNRSSAVSGQPCMPQVCLKWMQRSVKHKSHQVSVSTRFMFLSCIVACGCTVYALAICFCKKLQLMRSQESELSGTQKHWTEQEKRLARIYCYIDIIVIEQSVSLPKFSIIFLLYIPPLIIFHVWSLCPFAH